MVAFEKFHLCTHRVRVGLISRSRLWIGWPWPWSLNSATLSLSTWFCEVWQANVWIRCGDDVGCHRLRQQIPWRERPPSGKREAWEPHCTNSWRLNGSSHILNHSTLVGILDHYTCIWGKSTSQWIWPSRKSWETAFWRRWTWHPSADSCQLQSIFKDLEMKATHCQTPKLPLGTTCATMKAN